jgi:hypothetical protein
MHLSLESAKDEFGDNEQIRLAKFCEEIDAFGHQWDIKQF